MQRNVILSHYLKWNMNTSFYFAKRMNHAIRKFISLLLLVIFLSGAGGGQVIHSIFHKHPGFVTVQSSVSISTPRTFCPALQLMLPEFSETNACIVPLANSHLNNFFDQPQPSFSHYYFFKTSDRAPPVLA